MIEGSEFFSFLLCKGYTINAHMWPFRFPFGVERALISRVAVLSVP
jgi:hypothetical protein